MPLTQPSLRAATLLPAALSLIVLAACQDEQARGAPAAPGPGHPGRPPAPAERTPVHEASADLVSVSEAEGRVLVELPIGSAQGVAVGAFFRVYDAADARRLKGMVQITEVIDAQRAVARQIALSDRASPFKPGDHAREISDLTKLADGAAIESTARAEQGRLAEADSQEQQRFTALREQYQRELAVAESRHQAEMQNLRDQQAAQLTAADARHAHELELKQLELRTDLATLKTTLSEQVTAGIAADHNAGERRLASMSAEKAALQIQVDGLLKQQGELSLRISALVKELASHDRSHGEELRAEVETRELLAARIAELEARVSGKPLAPSVVLSNEPGRNETVLERLARITKELTAEREHAKREEATLSEVQEALLTAKEAAKSLAVKVNLLAPDAERAATLGADMERTRSRLQEAERQRDALELQRLEAERSLYDLAARVLRLAGTSPETVALQARLRDVLTPSPGEQPAPAASATPKTSP